MSNVILYRDEHLAFSKDIMKSTGTMIKMPLSAWICKLGLIIPISPSSYSAVRIFDGKVAGIPEQKLTINGLLMRMDGSICQFGIDPILGVYDSSNPRYTNELPVGPEITWATSEFETYEEKAYATLVLCEDRKDVLPLLIKTDLIMGKSLQWYNVAELAKTVTELHKAKYPDLHIEIKDK